MLNDKQLTQFQTDGYTAVPDTNGRVTELETLRDSLVDEIPPLPLGGVYYSATDYLILTFDAWYGPGAWLPLFQEAFDTWEALTGIEFRYEDDDDGVADGVDADPLDPNVCRDTDAEHRELLERTAERIEAFAFWAIDSTNASPRPTAPAGGATSSLFAMPSSNSLTSDLSMRWPNVASTTTVMEVSGYSSMKAITASLNWARLGSERPSVAMLDPSTTTWAGPLDDVIASLL